MLEQLTDPDNLPFAVALAVMLALAAIQILGLGDLLGGDSDIDADGDVALDTGLLSLIGLRRLPFLMWLMLLLATFGIIGLAGQQLIEAVSGTTLDGWIAAPLAALAGLPATGLLARPFAALMPRDETSAVSLDTLVGRQASIVIGIARRDSPARAKVKDLHGQVHYVMVEPDIDDQEFVEGEHLLLVRREGGIFKAISRGDHYLPRSD